jgi:hypothetical protein
VGPVRTGFSVGPPACAKAGSKYCTTYCSQQLKDEQLAKICK